MEIIGEGRMMKRTTMKMMTRAGATKWRK